MQKQLLPIGIQDFRTIREEGFYYVDKTSLIFELVDRGVYYFLSRPRRFGKSLLIDTLLESFLGNEPLFRGLAIHDQWDWNETYPVIRLSFDGVGNEPGDLAHNIQEQLKTIERNFGLKLGSPTDEGPDRFMDLLDKLHRKTGRRVVVLVDEYDKPVLDVLDKPDLAESNRDYLRAFYGIIKGAARDVRFVFVTGISRLTMASMFSGLNNLENITLDPRFATICGFTDNDLDTVFAPELNGLDRSEIRRRYLGYNWLGEERLYNPWDILLLLDERAFKAHWFETGTAQMIYQKIVEEKRNLLELEKTLADEGLMSSFDESNIDLRALMFQSGYLTITGETFLGNEKVFELGFPNHEVRQNFSKGLLIHAGLERVKLLETGNALLNLLIEEDFDAFSKQLKTYLAGIPHQWYDAGGVNRFEAYYAGMLYFCFRAVGANVIAEDASSHGRADMVLLHGSKLFVFEFKMVGEGESPESALDQAMLQIHERGYADKYRDRDEPIHLVAAVFGSERRNLRELRAEAA